MTTWDKHCEYNLFVEGLLTNLTNAAENESKDGQGLQSFRPATILKLLGAGEILTHAWAEWKGMQGLKRRNMTRNGLKVWIFILIERKIFCNIGAMKF